MYQIIKDSNSIKRIADGAFIPADPANMDYTAYLAWVDAGNTPEPAPPPPPPPVPQAVTMRQARLVLLGAGLLSQVEAAIDALPSPQKEAARIEWEYSQEVQRYNGFVAVLAPALGLSESQIDQMFFAASGL